MKEDIRKRSETAVGDVLTIAAGELGTTESPAGSNRTKYGKWMGLDGQSWCMSFVQWCFDQAGRPLPYRTASCGELLRWYQRYAPERIVTAPKARDVIIYTFGHTGIVEGAKTGTVTAIEGNTSPGEAGSQDNGGGVFRRTRRRALVKAFIRPYDNYEEDDEVVTYKTLNDVPSCYKAAVQKCIDKNALKGTSNKEINVSEDLCRTLTVLDRLGKLD